MRLRLGAVRLPRARAARWTAGAVALVAIAAVTAVATTRGRTATPTAAASTVSVVRRGTVAVTASAAGTVEAASTRGLSFSVTGTVTEVDVHAGDSVTAGQVLAKIDSSDAQSQVDSAQDAVDAAENAVATAEQAATATPQPASGGCVAEAGYVVAGGPTGSASPSATPTPTSSATPTPTPTPTATPPRQPQPSVTPTGRTGTPGQNGSGGQDGSGQGGSAPGDGGRTGGGATGGCGSGNGTTGGSAGGNGGGTGSGRGGTDSLFAAQEQLNNAQLQLVQAQRRLAGTTITAPVAGRVLSIAGTVGSTASASSAFVTLGGLADTEVTASFTETDVAHLAVGQPATITLPDRSGGPLTGKVVEVSPAGTVSGQLVRYPVFISFDQVPSDLLYGQSADVAVTVQSVDNVLYVSSSAVTGVHDGTGTVTVRAGGRDEQRTVHIGLRGDQYTEIRSGLAEGDSVVIGGR